MSGAPTYYRDGYTRRVFLKGEPGLYGDVEIEMRPMLVEERDQLQSVVQSKPPAVFNAAIRAELAKRIVSWNATDDRGQAVEVNAANVGRVPPKLYDRLYWVMTGRDAGDPLPGATDGESDDYLKNLIGDQTEADAKN